MAQTHVARTAEVERVGKLVRVLDDAVRIPGTRFGFGLDALLGLVLPGIGDAITGALSLVVMRTAVRRGVPRIVLARMLLNIVVDTGLGLVPVVGDAFDFAWRSNLRNQKLLERHQGELEPKARPGDVAIVGAAAAFVAAGVVAPFFLLAWLVSFFA